MDRITNERGTDGHVVLESVYKHYRSGVENLTILHDVHMSIDYASTVGITGESGSGKSTLLNLISGLDMPSSGSVRCDGHHVSHASESDLTEYRRRSVGLVYQFHYLLRDFTALENVMLPGRVAGMETHAARTRARELLRRVGLEDREDHEPSRLSGGERQRVALARALMNSPGLLLADEPTGNLDEKNSRIVESLMFELVDEVGATLLLVTHDQELAGRCDQTFRLSKGCIERA
ncbi:MAG: ABC transporter ATP-binding protein [Spirochaetaceae bacterium]